MKAGKTLKRKLANVKPKFWRFVGQIKTNVIFPLNIEKNTHKKSNKFKNFDFFFLFGLFCAFKTLTIDLVHFYCIITAENVGTRISLTNNIFWLNYVKKIKKRKNFENFLGDLMENTFCRHPEGIWCTLIASKSS
jgi:hypothetical protein